MQNFQRYMKPCAVVLCLAYVIFILACPFFIIKASASMLGVSQSMSEGTSFSDVVDETGWPILAVVTGVLMGAAVCFLPGKPACGVCLVGTFLVLVSFWLSKGHFDDQLKALNSSLMGMGSASMNLGTGPILAMICGALAAALCWMSGQAPQKRKNAPTPDSVYRNNNNLYGR